VEDVTDPQAEVVRGYCAAVRSLTKSPYSQRFSVTSVLPATNIGLEGGRRRRSGRIFIHGGGRARPAGLRCER
jgi:hypothetical protein